MKWEKIFSNYLFDKVNIQNIERTYTTQFKKNLI